MKVHHRYKFLDLYITASNTTLYIHAFFNTNVCLNDKYLSNKYSFNTVFFIEIQIIVLIKNLTIMKKLSFAELKGRVSWGSVFGGVMTVLAISVLLSILNSSIGLFMFDPLSGHPASGIGTAVGIGSAVILITGMAAGGFVAGKLAGMDGMIHGFLVWATTLIVAVVLGVFWQLVR